jgi:hypothetical protein
MDDLYNSHIVYDFWDVEQNKIEESNVCFATAVSKYINEPQDILYNNVIREYGLLAQTNPIAKFNLEHIYFTVLKRNSCKVNKTYL